MSEIAYHPTADRAVSLTGLSALEVDCLPTLRALKLDIRRAKPLGRKGDLTVILTQLDFGDGRDEQPALLIAHHINPTEHNVYIALADLYRMVGRNGAEHDQAVMACAERLYGLVSRAGVFAVLDVIYEYAEDLLHAPPPRFIDARQWARALAADGLTMLHNGVPMAGANDD